MARKYVKKTRTRKRRMYKPRLYRPIPSNKRIFNLKRSVELSPITIGAVGSGGNIGFTLTQLPNASELTGLFDFYRIKAVSIRFIPNIGGGSELSSAPVTAGYFTTAIDRNDLTNPTARSDLLQYQNYKMTKLTNQHKRYFKVNTIDDNGQQWNRWISNSSTTTQYYGLKYWKDGISTGTGFSLVPFVTYYIQCKGTI